VTAETKKAPKRRFLLNWWVVQDKPWPVRGHALRVMLSHQPESLPAIQSNLRRFSSGTFNSVLQKRKKRLKGAFF